MSRPIEISKPPANLPMGPGMFQNHRPDHIKAYAEYVRKFGKEKADAMYGKPDDWVASQKSRGLQSSIYYPPRGGKRRTRKQKKSKRKTRRT
jgi:hypothetical protein